MGSPWPCTVLGVVNKVKDYLVRFDVREVHPSVEAALLADGRFSVGLRAGKWTVEAEDEGRSAVEVAKRLASELKALGVTVLEALPELVTMADISRRAGVSKQAVSKWVNQDVRGDAFPRPWNSTDTTLLWDWCPVNDWLRSRDRGHDEWDVLTASQINQVNEWLRIQDIPQRPADSVLHPVIAQEASPRSQRVLHVQTI